MASLAPKREAVKNRTREVWGVEIEGRSFPVKQVMRPLIDDPRSDWFNSQRARDWLSRLGFRTFNTHREGVQQPTVHADTGGASTRRQSVMSDTTVNVRLAALTMAIEFMSHRDHSEVEDVLKIADKFTEWILGEDTGRTT